MSGTIPQAWPLWLSREQALAYLGDIAEKTFLKICPVAPVDMGASIIRYRRYELEAWEASLGHRLPRRPASVEDAAPAEPPPAANDRPLSPVQRARARASRKS